MEFVLADYVLTKGWAGVWMQGFHKQVFFFSKLIKWYLSPVVDMTTSLAGRSKQAFSCQLSAFLGD